MILPFLLRTSRGRLLLAAFALAALPAFSQQAPVQTLAQPPASDDGDANPVYTQPDAARRADAYYNFAMGHLNERLYEVSGLADYANDAIDFYKKAIGLDPKALEINVDLAETYAKLQRIRDAVTEAQSVLRQNPDNLGAHRLLARIYVRTLGEADATGDQKATIELAAEQFGEILRIEPQDDEAALWLARLDRYENKHDDAERTLRSLLQREPGNESALEQLGQLLMDQGRTQETIKMLTPAADEDTAELLDLLGDAHSRQHEYGEAEKAYQAAADAEPDEASHRKGLARTLLSEGKLDPALEQYQKLSRLEPESSENYLRMSQIYRRQTKYDLAERNLLLAKQHEPDSLEVLYNEALLYQIEARYEDAESVLTGAISRVKARSAIDSSANALSILYEMLGGVYRDQENYPDALNAFEDLGKLGPTEHKRSRLLIVDTYRQARDIDRALNEAKSAIGDYPDDQSLKTTYALLLADAGNTDEGAKLLESLLAGNSDDERVYLDLAEVYERGKQYPQAEDAAKKALGLARHASGREDAWFILGAIYERQKRFDDAEEQFRKVLDVNEHNAPTLNYLGYMLADRGVKLEEALSLARRALAEDPGNGAYLDSLGWTYFKQSRLPEAQKYLEQAVARDAHDPMILDHLGDVYARLGQTERAAGFWERAQGAWQKSLPVDYEQEKVAQLDKKLKNVKRRLAQKSSGDEKSQ
jgi:tetratricopeptide (TPR) repeat protein